MEPALESPRKKVKLSTEDSQWDAGIQHTTSIPHANTVNQPSDEMVSDVLASEDDKEAQVGITCYLAPESRHFKALLKKRYTDFLVNEILADGTVLHLQSLKPPRAANHVEEPESEAPAPKLEAVRSSLDRPPQSTNGSSIANGIHAADTTPSSSPQVSDEDKATVDSHFGNEVGAKIIDLYANILAHPDRKSSNHPTVESSAPIEDRTLRTQIHQDIRRIFHSRIESSTTKEGVLVLSAAPPSSNQKGKNLNSNRRGPQGRQGKPGWDDLGGEYLHFTIYKENKDTMEVISYLARELRMAPKNFQFAGTKDRRGVTVQRASVYRVEAGRVASLNRSLRYSNVGDFTHEKHGLELGDLGGNEFVITLRDCEWSSPHIQGVSIEDKITRIRAAVTKSMQDLHTKGYFNYFGLQRFGTFANRTDAVGLKLLQGDYKGACDIILSFPPNTLSAAQTNDPIAKISSEDKARAEAIHIFLTTGKSNPALEKLPRKFSAEQNVIRHLGKHKSDYMGAIMMIPRNLRIMYAHAYQSLVWNFAVSHRWNLHEDRVVEGDLVMVDEHDHKTNTTTYNPNHTTDTPSDPSAPLLDADGEPIIDPAPHDTATSLNTMFRRARALTAAEASSGHYSMHDIVLPLPGFDVLYPTGCAGMSSFYKDMMGRDGLDPDDMRRGQRDFSLSGSYRKILGRIEPDGWAIDVRRYAGDDEQFVETDLERLRKKPGQDRNGREPGREAEKEGSGGAHEREQQQEQQRHQQEENAKQDAGDKIALVIKMKLGASQYATMALRELSRGGIVAYKPDFGAGR